jgi:hypothetical protein
MKHLGIVVFFYLFIVQTGVSQNLSKQNLALGNKIKSVNSLVALWDFREKSGTERKASGISSFPLKEMNGPVRRVNEGPISGYAAEFNGENYLSLAHAETGALNIHGKDAQGTVIAWVKWTGTQTGFIGGMWNESTDGGKRQYGLFVSLPYYNGSDQVCGHISNTGKATPPFPYSIDYSASKQKVDKNKWCCVAFTYDSEYIKSYYNGKFEARLPELISHTKGFEGYPNGLTQSKNPYYYPDGMGDNGSDFTVGAVQLKNGMGNIFIGLIGGLAVYNRALSEYEIDFIANGPR